MILNIAIALYKKIDKHQFLFPKGIKKQFNFNGISLSIDMLDESAWIYNRMQSEAVNRFYQLVAQEHHPSIVLDIGANYGFITCILNKYLENAVFIAIEPNQRLIPYLEKNLYYNNVDGIVVNAVCTDHTFDIVDFFINPSGSQDSRVKGKRGWRKQLVKAVSIDSFLTNDETVFIKTDTQGYEEYVYKGGKEFFANNNKWLMRMEFCPALFDHHGTNTKEFLSELVSKYDVVDINSPAYTTPSLDYLFQSPLKLDSLDNFISYVSSLKEKNIGWTDILIRPKR